MLQIPCPFCGPRDHAEFTYGGDAGVTRPEMDSDDLGAWVDYIFIRDNPRGPHREFWHHVHGCREWLVVERDTASHAILGAHRARDRRAREGRRA